MARNTDKSTLEIILNALAAAKANELLSRKSVREEVNGAYEKHEMEDLSQPQVRGAQTREKEVEESVIEDEKDREEKEDKPQFRTKNEKKKKSLAKLSKLNIAKKK